MNYARNLKTMTWNVHQGIFVASSGDNCCTKIEFVVFLFGPVAEGLVFEFSFDLA